MLTPSLFNDNFDLSDCFYQDPWFGFDDREFKNLEKKLYGHRAKNIMNTDIKEREKEYEITMDIPGVKKEDVKAELKDGYLTVHASSDSRKEEKDTDGKFIRKERYYGSCSRSFFVGSEVTQEDIKAKFEDGTLKLLIPKKEAAKAVEQKNYIAIEG